MKGMREKAGKTLPRVTLLIICTFIVAILILTIIEVAAFDRYYGSYDHVTFNDGEEALIDYMGGWTDADGNTVDLSRLAKSMTKEGIKTTDLYARLPDGIVDGECLLFRSSNLFFSVEIAGEVIYTYDYDPIFTAGKGYGVDYHRIPLTREDSGRTITMHVRRVYRSSGDFFDMQIGDPMTYLQEEYRQTIPAFLLSFFLIVTGLVYLCMSFAINFADVNLQRSFRAMSVSVILLGTWSLLVTRVEVLLWGHAQIFRSFEYPMLLILPYTMLLTIEGWMEDPPRYVRPFACFWELLEIGGCLFCRIVLGRDLHECNYAIFGGIMLAGVFCTWMCIRQMFTVKTTRPKVNTAVIMASVSYCFISAMMDMIVYVKQGRAVTDQARYTRIAVTVMTLVMAVQYIREISYRVSKSVRASALEEMAYHDFLTGLGNRFASDKAAERLGEEMDQGKVSFVRIVSADVNFLKKINDLKGHEAGDTYLRFMAKALKESLPDRSEAFRTGGDEFAVFLPDCSEADYQTFREKLAANLKKYSVSAAEGCAIWQLRGGENEEDTFRDLHEAFRRADEHMYQEKVAMKAVRTN